MLPALSVAEHDTIVVPSASIESDAGSQFAVTTPSTRSLADALNVATAPDGPVASSETAGGTSIAGAVVSLTVTVKDALPVRPEAFIPEQVTVVAPSANIDPAAGEQLTATVSSTRSVADAEKVATAPAGPVASTVLAA